MTPSTPSHSSKPVWFPGWDGAFRRVRYHGWWRAAAKGRWERFEALLDWKRPALPLRMPIPPPECPHCRQRAESGRGRPQSKTLRVAVARWDSVMRLARDYRRGGEPSPTEPKRSETPLAVVWRQT